MAAPADAGPPIPRITTNHCTGRGLTLRLAPVGLARGCGDHVSLFSHQLCLEPVGRPRHRDGRPHRGNRGDVRAADGGVQTTGRAGHAGICAKLGEHGRQALQPGGGRRAARPPDLGRRQAAAGGHVLPHRRTHARAWQSRPGRTLCPPATGLPTEHPAVRRQLRTHRNPLRGCTPGGSVRAGRRTGGARADSRAGQRPGQHQGWPSAGSHRW